jgi:hypothetical protein
MGTAAARRRVGGLRPRLAAFRAGEIGLRVDSALPHGRIDENPAPTSVTLRPLITNLIVFDFVIGFFAGIMALVVCGLPGAGDDVMVAAGLVMPERLKERAAP